MEVLRPLNFCQAQTEARSTFTANVESYLKRNESFQISFRLLMNSRPEISAPTEAFGQVGLFFLAQLLEIEVTEVCRNRNVLELHLSSLFAARFGLGRPVFEKPASFRQLCDLLEEFVGWGERERGQGALALDRQVLVKQLRQQHEAVGQGLLEQLDGLSFLVGLGHVETVDVVAERSNERFDSKDSNGRLKLKRENIELRLSPEKQLYSSFFFSRRN